MNIGTREREDYWWILVMAISITSVAGLFLIGLVVMIMAKSDGSTGLLGD